MTQLHEALIQTQHRNRLAVVYMHTVSTGETLRDYYEIGLRKNIETVESLGIKIGEVRAVGRGLKSPVWLDILGKILRIPITTVSVRDTANLGNILLCGKALGVYPSYEEAVARMVTTDKRVFYEPGTPVYEGQYAIFLELYQQLKATFQQTASVAYYISVQNSLQPPTRLVDLFRSYAVEGDIGVV